MKHEWGELTGTLTAHGGGTERTCQRCGVQEYHHHDSTVFWVPGTTVTVADDPVCKETLAEEVTSGAV